MALITCKECGKQYSNQAPACPHCGCPTNVHDGNYVRCPKCGSSNILYQREQSSSIGGSIHSFREKRGHGCLYGLCFGWWIWIFKLIYEIFKICLTCGLSLFFRKNKNSIKGKTLSFSKSLNRTMAVCQNCGNSWKAKN